MRADRWELECLATRSYYYEAFDALDSLGDRKEAAAALKAQLLCKVMLDQGNEVKAITVSKLALKYAGRDVDAMRSVAEASADGSLAKLERARADYAAELGGDKFVNRHLGALADKLLEKNLLKVIEPFSHVETAHLAKLVGLSVDVTENRLAMMILDERFHGIIDQGKGIVIAHDAPVQDKAYTGVLETIDVLSDVTDALMAKSERVK